MDHPYPTSSDIAETIKAATKAARVSQRELAERSYIPLTTLNRKLNSSSLDWDELTAIAKALGRSASSLIAETEVRIAASQASSLAKAS